MSCQHGMLELSDETFHLALRYLDTFLLRRGPENFLARNGAGSEPVPALPPRRASVRPRAVPGRSHQPLCNKLKRLGITCVFVAAKVVEMCAPAGEFAHAAEVSTFSRSQLLLAERALLRELEYDLYHPTCSSFAAAYVSAAAATVAKDARIFKVKHKLNERDETDPVRLTAEVVEYVLEASAVARDGVAFAPSRSRRRRWAGPSRGSSPSPGRTCRSCAKFPGTPRVTWRPCFRSWTRWWWTSGPSRSRRRLAETPRKLGAAFLPTKSTRARRARCGSRSRGVRE